MSIRKINNLTKNNINKKINLKTGLPQEYINNIIEDFILILKSNINNNHVNIKNFGTFKIINKKERLGRNPKNNRIHLITARKMISFVSSKSLNEKINNL